MRIDVFRLGFSGSKALRCSVIVFGDGDCFWGCGGRAGVGVLRVSWFTGFGLAVSGSGLGLLFCSNATTRFPID